MSENEESNESAPPAKLSLKKPSELNSGSAVRPTVPMAGVQPPDGLSLKNPLPSGAGAAPASGLTLKKPGEAAGGLSLKKPSQISSGSAESLQPPGGLTLSKPGNLAGGGLSLKAPGQPAAGGLTPPGLTPPGGGLQKPSQIASVTGDALKLPGDLSLKKPGQLGGGGLSLKTPAAASAAVPPVPPAGLTPPGAGATLAPPGAGGIQAQAAEPMDMSETSLSLTLKTPGQIALDSKLAAPGDVMLTPTGESASGGGDVIGSGLRLRKPSEAASKDAPAAVEPAAIAPQSLSAISGGGAPTEPAADADGAEEFNDTTIDLKMKKPGDDKPKKLGLAAPRPGTATDPTPPGLAVPVGGPKIDLTPPGLESPAQIAADAEGDGAPTDAAADETDPAAEIGFARKAKRKMTRPQKITIGIMIPISLVIVALIGKLMIGLFSGSKDQPPPVAEVPATPAPEETPGEPGEPAQVDQPDVVEPGPVIPFPPALADQLESEYGKESREQFLSEWQKLTNYDREKYLTEIGAWEASMAVKDGVAILQFDEKSGATAFADRSGAGNNGICEGDNCPGSGHAGVFGTAVKFDGKDDFIRIPASESLALAASFSVSIWFYAVDFERQAPLVGWTDGRNLGVHLMARSSAYSWRGNGWGANVVADEGEGRDNIVSVQTPSKNMWHHLVASYNAASGRVIIYVDGKEGEARPVGKFKPRTGFDVVVGNLKAHGDAQFNGLIDALAIYDRVLTAEEVTREYERGYSKVKKLLGSK